MKWRRDRWDDQLVKVLRCVFVTCTLAALVIIPINCRFADEIVEKQEDHGGTYSLCDGKIIIHVGVGAQSSGEFGPSWIHNKCDDGRYAEFIGAPASGPIRRSGAIRGIIPPGDYVSINTSFLRNGDWSDAYFSPKELMEAPLSGELMEPPLVVRKRNLLGGRNIYFPVFFEAPLVPWLVIPLMAGIAAALWFLQFVSGVESDGRLRRAEDDLPARALAPSDSGGILAKGPDGEHVVTIHGDPAEQL